MLKNLYIYILKQNQIKRIESQTALEMNVPDNFNTTQTLAVTERSFTNTKIKVCKNYRTSYNTSSTHLKVQTLNF